MTGADVLARTLPSLVMIVGALLILRHWAQRGRSGSEAGVRVVTRTGITKGTAVAVLAIGDRRLLVGASEQGVSLLAELDPETTIDVSDGASVPDLTDATARETVAALTTPRPGIRPAALLARAFPNAPSRPTDRPRMAPIDRLRHLTVRRAVPSHPRRPNGVEPRT